MALPIPLAAHRPAGRGTKQGTSAWCSNPAYVGPPVCLAPHPFFFFLDEESTLPYYDERGHPKLYAPSAQLPNGEWAYSLSPRRFDPPLRGIALARHQAAIVEIRSAEWALP